RTARRGQREARTLYSSVLERYSTCVVRRGESCRSLPPRAAQGTHSQGRTTDEHGRAARVCPGLLRPDGGAVLLAATRVCHAGDPGQEPDAQLGADRAEHGDAGARAPARAGRGDAGGDAGADRKSTRLNSSHVKISYAVFCLKKKMNSYTSRIRH